MAKAGGDLVALWELSLPSGAYAIEFEHGTTSGKRIVRVNGREIRREEWMFKLVGDENFKVSKHQCTISIRPVAGFSYEYSLTVDGKPLEKFVKHQSKISQTWLCYVEANEARIVLEKDTMNVWCNGQLMETAGEFVDDGTETHFEIGKNQCCIRTISSGNKRQGLIHTLMINGSEVPPDTDYI